jgi:FAD/FMN-containing dehydrogenase
MAAPVARDIETLRERLAGPVLTAADGPAYDRARSVWNGAIDRRPAVIARCADANDVATAITFARTAGLEISVRGGAHNYGGAAVGDDGLTVDLSGMHDVSVDPVARRVRCGGGTTLAQLDAATAVHGLAAVGGTVSHTGVGGLTLGGGFGWLTPMHGLACDNLVSAHLVTADGRQLRVAADENPELFWALRGGGGNFGVVTEFEFRLHELADPVWLALLFYDLDHGVQALTLAGQVTSKLPARTGALIAATNAPPAPFVPERHHFAPGYALMLAGFGTDTEHTKLVDEVRAALPPLFEAVLPMPYPELQRMLDDTAPWGIQGYEKGLYLPQLSAEVVSVLCEHVPRKSSPMSIVPIFPMTGAYTTTPDADTAFGGPRAEGLVVSISAVAPTAELLTTDTGWVRDMWSALLPHANDPGGYVNFMSDYEFDRVRAAYGVAKYQRLARVKAVFDPDNVFHRNPNIVPAP